MKTKCGERSTSGERQHCVGKFKKESTVNDERILYLKKQNAKIWLTIFETKSCQNEYFGGSPLRCCTFVSGRLSLIVVFSYVEAHRRSILERIVKDS